MKETKFKQTEIGMIPSDWDVKTLIDTNHIETGSTPSTSDPSNYGCEYLFVSPIDLGDDKYIHQTEKKLSKKGFSLCRHFPKNSILYTCIGSTIGKSGIANSELTSNQQINAVFPNALIDNEYLYYALQIRTEDIRGRAGQQAVPLINKTEFGQTLYLLPPTIEEQKRIAQALSDIDAVISTTEKLIAKKKALKQGAMQTLLSGKMRIQNGKWIKTTHFKQTELGPIPQEWEVKSFGELFEILPNNTLSRAELNEGQGSYKNVHYGDVLVKFQEWIDCSKTALPFINSDAKFNHTSLQDGDVIIADTAEDETVGKSTEIFNARNIKIVSGLHTIPIRPKTKFASKWLGYFINSACWHDQILPFITGTKVSAISKAAVAQTKFFYPAKMDEQTAIATVLSDMDSEIAALETKLAKYRQLKTGMMQQLLTGKVRLV